MKIETIIKHYLEGTISESQSQELDQWLSEDPFHKEAFVAYEQKWLQMKAIKDANIEVELEDVPRSSFFSILQIRFQGFVEKAKKYIHNQSPFFKYGLGASLFIFFAILIGISFQKDPNYFLSADPDGVQSKEISEKSKLWINSNGQISYKKRFRNRTVYVDGEVYFEVNETRPITIFTNGLIITSTNAKFNVCSYLNKEMAEICVAEGSIKIEIEGQAGLTSSKLKKGQKLMYNKKDKLFQPTKNHDVNFNSWCTRELVFNDTDLGNIAMNVEKYFGKPVKFSNEKINKCTFTGVFNLNDPEKILLAVAHELNLEFDETKNSYLLIGEGCGVKEQRKFGFQ